MRYTGSIFKKSRRYGISLLENNKEFLKGRKRTTAPGQHGDKKVKLTGYGEQLREKQRLQYMYGITDRQFRRMFSIAEKMKGNLSMNLLIVLESRLDNLVYRMGFAPTRKAARQLVSHGHILLNGKKCDIPSTIVGLKQSIEVKDKSKKLPIVNSNEVIKPLPFVEVSADKKGTYIRYPQRPELNLDINETYVVE
ncbi:30S ribosomal protein S4 [bacterium]|nr:30S ribosomal protein S4 [bacterium]